MLQCWADIAGLKLCCLETQQPWEWILEGLSSMRSALSKVPRLTLFHFFFFNFLTCHHHHMLSGPPCFPTILLWSGLPHLYRCRLKKKFSRECFWELNYSPLFSYLLSADNRSEKLFFPWCPGVTTGVGARVTVRRCLLWAWLGGWVCVCEMLREAGAAACGTLNASAPGDAELNAWCRAAAASPW